MSNVPRKYLVFDIETAKILPARVDDLLAHRPLGITCAAALCQDKDTASVFFSKEDDGSPSAQMDKEAASAFVDFLSAKVKEGYTLLTFNGLGFDFDVRNCSRCDAFKPHHGRRS